MNSKTPHSKKLRGDTANKSQKKIIKEGGYRFTVLLRNKEIAEKAREIPNKTEFLKMAINKLLPI